MSKFFQVTRGSFCATIAALGLVAGCTKQPDGAEQGAVSSLACERIADPKPSDDSPTSKARAVSDGIALREDCAKRLGASSPGSEDLAKIRSIKETEQAEKDAKRISDKEYSDALAKSGSAPRTKITY
jgi:hypothetical protein